MELLRLIMGRESYSLNRKIKKLLDRIETKSCSEKQFNKFLSNLDFYLEAAKEFNEEYSHKFPSCEIPVGNYEARLYLAKEAGTCSDSDD